MHVIYHTVGNLQLIAFLHELELTRVSRKAISYSVAERLRVVTLNPMVVGSNPALGALEKAPFPVPRVD